jgi:ubiquinone/menaquinone biosynthesis C-methylase UbiE
MKITKKEVELANIKFFSANAFNYNKKEPNYLPENKIRVRNILKNLSKRTSHKSMLDVGCGTGFILDLAFPYFQRLYGIDMTKAMLDQVNLRNGKVKVFEENSEKIPFENDSFDACTAYGFLHHLYRLKPTFKEIYRCLKKGGIFYSDQDPNYYYWQYLSSFDLNTLKDEIIRKEILSVQKPAEGFRWNEMANYEKIGEKTVSVAEYQKVVKKGLHSEKIRETLSDIGFKKIDIFYEWYLGEGYVYHKISPKAGKIIYQYLTKCIPLTRNLFKYIRIIAVK